HGQHDRARIAGNRIAIEVEAALAFGTGHHATTRGCLLALDTLVKRQRTRPKRILVRAGYGRSNAGSALPLPWAHVARQERVGVRGQVTSAGPVPPHPLALLATSPQRGEVKRILDLGTGSGVLAIAAARSLRRPVLASDIDPTAVVVARNN